jgi:hypothetical protein
MHQTIVSNRRPELSNGEGIRIWQKALAALAEGDINQALNQFGDQFTFTDAALGLEFKEKDQLLEYFGKIRKFFPDSKRTDHTPLSVGEAIVSKWTLTATQSEPFAYGRFLKVNIEAHGVSVVRVSDGSIVEWSEYYDQVRSRRYRLAGQFGDWCEI